MSGIPERGYGTWRQWRRRVLKEKNGMMPASFCVNYGSDSETRKWQEIHMARLPAYCGITKSSVKAATEMQV